MHAQLAPTPPPPPLPYCLRPSAIFFLSRPSSVLSFCHASGKQQPPYIFHADGNSRKTSPPLLFLLPTVPFLENICPVQLFRPTGADNWPELNRSWWWRRNNGVRGLKERGGPRMLFSQTNCGLEAQLLLPNTLALRGRHFTVEADAFHGKLGARNSVTNDLRML